MTDTTVFNNERGCVELSNPIYEGPILEFDESQRERARSEVEEINEGLRDKEISNEEIQDSRAHVIELVVTHGLFEYYSHIEELSNPQRMERLINYISSKESDKVSSSLKRIELRDHYWTNVIFPHIATRIISNNLEQIDEYKLILLEKSIIPSDKVGKRRVGLMSKLVKYYKESEPEEQERIRMFLEKSIADYPTGS